MQALSQRFNRKSSQDKEETGLRRCSKQYSLDTDLLQRDVCGWITGTLCIEMDTANVKKSLKSGVVLCKIAANLENQQTKWSLAKGEMWRPMRVKCNERAKSGSFLARDNITVFLQWAARIVSEDKLFEVADAADGTGIDTIMQTLQDISRELLCVPPTELVSFERAIKDNQFFPDMDCLEIELRDALLAITRDPMQRAHLLKQHSFEAESAGRRSKRGSSAQRILGRVFGSRKGDDSASAPLVSSSSSAAAASTSGSANGIHDGDASRSASGHGDGESDCHSDTSNTSTSGSGRLSRGKSLTSIFKLRRKSSSLSFGADGTGTSLPKPRSKALEISAPVLTSTTRGEGGHMIEAGQHNATASVTSVPKPRTASATKVKPVASSAMNIAEPQQGMEQEQKQNQSQQPLTRSSIAAVLNAQRRPLPPPRGAKPPLVSSDSYASVISTTDTVVSPSSIPSSAGSSTQLLSSPQSSSLLPTLTSGSLPLPKRLKSRQTSSVSTVSQSTEVEAIDNVRKDQQHQQHQQGIHPAEDTDQRQPLSSQDSTGKDVYLTIKNAEETDFHAFSEDQVEDDGAMSDASDDTVVDVTEQQSHSDSFEPSEPGHALVIPAVAQKSSPPPAAKPPLIVPRVHRVPVPVPPARPSRHAMPTSASTPVSNSPSTTVKAPVAAPRKQSPVPPVKPPKPATKSKANSKPRPQPTQLQTPSVSKAAAPMVQQSVSASPSLPPPTKRLSSSSLLLQLTSQKSVSTTSQKEESTLGPVPSTDTGYELKTTPEKPTKSIKPKRIGKSASRTSLDEDLYLMPSRQRSSMPSSPMGEQSIESLEARAKVLGFAVIKQDELDELVKQKERTTSAVARAESLNEKVSQLTKELLEVQQELGATKHQAALHAERESDLEQEVIANVSQLDAMAVELASKTKGMADLQAKVEGLENQVTVLEQCQRDAELQHHDALQAALEQQQCDEQERDPAAAAALNKLLLTLQSHFTEWKEDTEIVEDDEEGASSDHAPPTMACLKNIVRACAESSSNETEWNSFEDHVFEVISDYKAQQVCRGQRMASLSAQLFGMQQHCDQLQTDNAQQHQQIGYLQHQVSQSDETSDVKIRIRQGEPTQRLILQVADEHGQDREISCVLSINS
eukprot:m.331193 g.331193  ORF g.331193 m.331193 type:complete len:1132 (-) comp16053_c1_seq7:279-3674(-)